MRRADPHCCLTDIHADRERCVVLSEREQAMARTPRTTPPPRSRPQPTARVLSGEDRVELVTTADVVATVPRDATYLVDDNTVGVLLWAQEVPGFWQALQRTVKSDCAGKSIIKLLEDELDVVVERLMSGAEAETDRGFALGLAHALATFFNPYKPNIDAVREAAMERYDAAGHDD